MAWAWVSPVSWVRFRNLSSSSSASSSSTQAPAPAHCISTSNSSLTSVNSFTSDTKTKAIQARLSNLCKKGHPDAALRILESYPDPTALLWNTLLIGYICNARPADALRLYPAVAFAPDAYTFSALLKACALLTRLHLGRSLHCHILRTRRRLTPVLANSLLAMYSACSDNARPVLVRRVFDAMRVRNVVTWNTMVAWYVRTGRAEMGVDHFKLMLEQGLKPSPVSFVNVFKSAAEVGDGKLATVLYALLLKCGSDYSDDMFVVGSAVYMYCRLGLVLSARRVFDLCENKNVEVWNAMMDGYVQNDLPFESIILFLELVVGNGVVAPDDVTFLAAIMAASQLQELKLGRQLHSYVMKRCPELPIVLSNALAVMYSRCDDVNAAFRVFETMAARDVVTWNTMVSAFVQKGSDAEGVLLVREMQKQHVEIDAITVIALLSAASNLRDLKMGQQVHGYVFRHGIEFEGMIGYLIDMYAKSGVMKLAENLFENGDINAMDQVTWNAMIAGFVQNTQHQEAISIFKEMIELNKMPNSVTIASLLPACDPASSSCGVGQGKQLHGYAIRHLLDKNVFIETALVDMYAKGGSISQAESVFSMMSEKSCVTYTTMILGYGQNGRGEDALSLFNAMPELGVEPDAVTLVAVLSACSYAGLVIEGINIFESMEEKYGIAPSFEHRACLVDILGRAGKVKEAYEFVEAMGEENNVVGIWGSLLAACRIHREFELGKLVAERLLEMERRGTDLAGYHVLISNMLAETGEWDGADVVRKEMRERGLRKELGCSWIDVGGVVHRFASRDQRHAMSEILHGVVEELSVSMKFDRHGLGIDHPKNLDLLQLEPN